MGQILPTAWAKDGAKPAATPSESPAPRTPKVATPTATTAPSTRQNEDAQSPGSASESQRRMVAHKEEERMLIKAKRRARTVRHHRAVAVRNALRDLSNFVPKNAHLVILPTSPASSTASSTTATSASPLPSPFPCAQRLHPFTPSPTPSPRTLALATPPRLETIPSIAEYLPDGQFAQHDRDELEAILALLECPSAECRSKSNVGLQPPPSPVQTLSVAGSEVDFGAANEEEKTPDAMTSHDGDPHPLRCSHDDTTDSTGGTAKIQADRDLASAHIESRDCNKNNKSQERDQGHGDISAESEKSEEMPFPFISFEMCDRESNAHIQVQAVQRRASLNATLHEIMNIEEDQEKRNELISEMEGFLSGEMQDTSVYTLSVAEKEFGELGQQIELESLRRPFASCPYQEALWHIALRTIQLNPERQRLVLQCRESLLPREDSLRAFSMSQRGRACFVLRQRLVHALRHNGQILFPCHGCGSGIAAKDCAYAACARCCSAQTHLKTSDDEENPCPRHTRKRPRGHQEGAIRRHIPARACRRRCR